MVVEGAPSIVRRRVVPHHTLAGPVHTSTTTSSSVMEIDSPLGPVRCLAIFLLAICVMYIFIHQMPVAQNKKEGKV